MVALPLADLMIILHIIQDKHFFDETLDLIASLVSIPNLFYVEYTTSKQRPSVWPVHSLCNKQQE